MKRTITFTVAWFALMSLLTPVRAADAVILVPLGATWKYLDDGSNQGTNWITPTFDDSSWAAGPAQLGFGDGDEATVISFGSDSDNKHITTYFRRVFDAGDPSGFVVARIRVRRDDGVIVYLNGQEIFRDNLPVGTVNYDTFASQAAPDDGADLQETLVNPALLLPGNNVLAVEMHQNSRSSSDLSFDLELAGSTDPVFNYPPSVYIASPPDQTFFSEPASFLIVARPSDSDGTISLVEFFSNGLKIGQDASLPLYTYNYLNVMGGTYQLTAVATDNLGSRATSAVVNVFVVAPSPPSVAVVQPTPGTVSSLSTIAVTFTEPVVGMEPQWLLVNGEPALTLSGSGATYTFGFSQPLPGPVQVLFDVDNPIADLEGNPFDASEASAIWNYYLADSLPPEVLRLTPVAGAVVTALDQVEVFFNEPVTGVSATDLLINSQPADAVTGSGAGPYVFTFDQPVVGTVQMGWAPGHGIRDLANTPNEFDGGIWSYTLTPSFAPNIVLNEILADNLTGLADEDLQKQDWIELRNRGASAVSLLGMSISDDPEIPGKWVLPSITLGAGQYLVIFASGKDRVTTLPGTTNHLNFQLAVSGGYLGLYNANFPRQPLDQFDPEYPELRGDISYGRTASGGLVWFQTPTPGAANADGSALSGIVQPPHPSVESGLFNHPFEVVLSSSTPGARVHYTLDASTPTEQSEEYFLPIQVEGTPRKGSVVLRAKAFAAGQLPSTVTTRTYIFPEHILTQPQDPDNAPDVWDSPGSLQSSVPDYEMDPDVVNASGNRQLILDGLAAIPSISIVTDSNLVWSEAAGFYVRKTYDEIPVQCNAELFMPNGSEDGFNVDCGIRVVGGTSPDNNGTYPTGGWKSRKLSMRLIFRGEFGGTKLRYQMFPDSPVDRFDTVVIDAGLNNVWSYNGGSSPDDQRRRAEYCRDQFMSDLQNALGGAAPHGRHVHIYINGLYWGIHGLHERPDDSFAAEYFGGDKNEYDALKHNLNANNLVNGSSAPYIEMFNIARSGLADNAVYENLQRHLDLPAFIDYMIVNIWGGNTDWAHQNWYATKRRTPEGRWRYHSWDAEHSMEATGTSVTGKNDSNGPTELLQLLRQNAEFRLLFADHVRRHFFNGGQFYVDPANPVYDPAHPERNRPAALFMQRLGAIYPGPLTAESARWGDTAQTGSYTAYVPLTVEGELQNQVDSLLGIRQTTYAPHSSVWNLFPTRSGIAFNQLSNTTVGLYTTIMAPSFSQHGGRVPVGFNLTMSGPGGGSIYYTTNGIDPRVYGSGKLSAHAVQYTGSPVVLNTSTMVKARVLSGATWSALNEALFVIEELTVPLRITEIMYNPIGGDAYEFLELRNVGAAPIDLGSVVFSSGINFVFPVGASIAPGVTIVLANNNSPASFATRYPGVSVYGYFGGSLANGGERLVLKDAAGKTILSVQYDDENGWPIAADGQGPSLEIIDVHGDASDPANWRASDLAGGSPGLPPAAPAASQVVLNEIMAENLTAVDVDGTFPDFVELYNAGPGEVDLTGWSLTDNNNPRRFVFPSDTLLAAGAYLMVWMDTNAGSGLHAGFALDREGETVSLYNANTSRVDAVSFGLLPSDYTLGRIDGEWQLTVATTNAPNVAAALANASSLGINEWMANPVPGQDDWVELYNRSSTAPVALQGIYLGTSNALFQFRYPAFLPPNGFLQLFAEERSGVNELDFKLPAASGAIILYDNTGLEQERVTYGAQASGVSSGRYPDGSLSLPRTFPGSASPGASNYLFAYTGPVLSEVLARNQSAVLSPWNTYADFVELRNPSGVPFDLSGMRLSADPDPTDAFVFAPGTSIGGNGYLVVWWDGSRPAQTNGPSYNTGSALNGTGGVYLFTALGQAAAKVEYGFQVANLSIGLQGTTWQLVSAPTPGTANTAPAPLGTVGNLRLNEWMADPADGNDWFEIYNDSALPVQMDGLYLTDNPSILGQTNFVVPPLSFIGAQGFVRWEADGAAGKGFNHVSFSLDNAGETILLYRNNQVLIDGISFGRQIKGVSQGRLPDGQNGIVSFTVSASPEASNYLPLTDVVVSEALTHTDPPLQDAIELQNLSNGDLDVSGWYLTDGQDSFRKYRFPAGSVIPPGGFLVVYEDQLDGGPGSLVPFTLDSVRGDDVWLTQADAGDNLTGYRARAKFGAAANGVSFGRYMTSVGVDFPPQKQRTLNEENAGPLVGPVVINEIMYRAPNPGETNDNSLLEYVELYNLSANPVPLYDPAHPSNSWHLAEAVDMSFPSAPTLAPRGYLLAVSFDPILDQGSLALFRAYYNIPAEVPIYGPFQGRLSNTGESVELLRPDTPQGPGPEEGYVPYLLVDQVAYDDDYPWALEADGLGATLQRRRPHDYGNDPVNWKGEEPTPGRANVPGFGYVDTDQDGLPDDYETANALDPNLASDAAQDPDGDSESTYHEFLAGTNPRNATNVLAAPLITSQPENQVIELGTSVSLNVTVSGTAPLSYQWYRNGGLLDGATNPVLSFAQATTADVGRYHAVIWNTGGFAVSRAASLAVNVPPRITHQPDDLTVTSGSTALFTVSAIGTGQLRYQWQRNGVDLPGAISATLTLTNAQVDLQGFYRVIVTDDLGSTTSEVALLKVLEAPSFVRHPQSQSVVEGANVTFTVQTRGTLPMGYRWRLSFGTIRNVVLNGFADSVTISNVPASYNGYPITCVITNEVFFTPGYISDSAILTVLADTDHDGMDDAFETAAGLNPNDPSDAGLDADEDGVSNRDEYIAGTDPNDPGSYLKVEIVQDTSGGLGERTLRFRAQAGKSYSILYKDALDGVSWQKLVDVELETQARDVDITDPSAGSVGQRFYRLVTPKQIE